MNKNNNSTSKTVDEKISCDNSIKGKLLCTFNTVFFFFFIFSHFYVGSMCLVRRLHLGRSCASSPENSLSDKSFLMLSNHLHFGLPLLLFPGTFIPITLLPTYSSSLLKTWIRLQPTLLRFLGNFSHFRRPSNSFIPNSVHLGDSTHPTTSFPPHPTSSLVLS